MNIKLLQGLLVLVKVGGEVCLITVLRLLLQLGLAGG
jgi:hypothetical protein